MTAAYGLTGTIAATLQSYGPDPFGEPDLLASVPLDEALGSPPAS